MQKNHTCEILAIGIIALFIIVTINVIGEDTTDELIDQYQVEDNTYFYSWGPWWYAQSFKPSLFTLTRIELLGSSVNLDVPLEISIRQNLTGPDLSYISIPSNELPNTNSWIDIDLPNITVIPETTYYIVLRNAGDIDHAFRWAAIHGILDYYSRGDSYWSYNSGQDWIRSGDPDEYFDACFKTYGRINQPPNPPIINGITNGKVGVTYEYTFNSTDNDGDSFLCYVDWDDGSPIEIVYPTWSNPDEQGPGKAYHSWNNTGNYIIKAVAEDENGLLSGYGYLEVTMPRTKTSVCSYCFRFFDIFPILQRILNMMR